MKKAFLFVLALATVVAAAPFAAASPARFAPLKTYDIVFDGYCDGMHLEFPSAGLGNYQTVDGYQTGCIEGGIFGQADSTRSTGYLTVPAFATFTVVTNRHTWVHYGFNGNLIYVVNSGTWSYGTPLGRTGVASNTRRAGAAAVGNRGVNDLDLMFDGYCDGMHLVNPSAGLGTPTSVDGYRTGCSAEALIGATASVANQAGTYVVTFDTAGLWVSTAIFPNHTWIHYAIDGNSIFLLNFGTWSNAIAGGHGRNSVSR
jgi:hypothetical protein